MKIKILQCNIIENNKCIYTETPNDIIEFNDIKKYKKDKIETYLRKYINNIDIDFTYVEVDNENNIIKNSIDNKNNIIKNNIENK